MHDRSSTQTGELGVDLRPAQAGGILGDAHVDSVAFGRGPTVVGGGRDASQSPAYANGFDEVVRCRRKGIPPATHSQHVASGDCGCQLG
ncbi:hypothetical protein GCM10009749_13870 [Agromyces neolithicus]|uniref:Uncharacterized protein n=1 Tax=Agromyces neolithicus TaxID=269420 RepID=A0ABP4Y981_9MICO